MADAAAAEKTEKLPYIPHELVTLILDRLPLEPLLRLRGVCKEWQFTIHADASVRIARLRVQTQRYMLLHRAYTKAKARGKRKRKAGGDSPRARKARRTMQRVLLKFETSDV